MKKAFILFSSITIMYMGIFSSCTKKNMQTSTPTKTVVKESPQTAKPKPSNSKEETVVVKEKKTVSVNSIEQEFKKQHTRASDILWSKDSILNEDTNNPTSYKVVYLEDGKKGVIIYNSEGKIIEEKHQILTDQLSQTIYNAIKKSYPDYKIVDVYTYKHITKEGTYYVITEKSSNVSNDQVILYVKEDGTFVQ